MNLRPAPVWLTPAQVAALVDASAAPLLTTMLLPVEPTQLVDRPRRSEDPRLAKANDDGREVQQMRLPMHPLPHLAGHPLPEGGEA